MAAKYRLLDESVSFEGCALSAIGLVEA